MGLLRPYGVMIDGELELGLELVLHEGVIKEVRPHTGIPDAFVISPAFVNAHSHLEYRDLQGKLTATEYWPWIREITLAKRDQSLEDVRRDAIQAARENVATGVALIGEHSDRPVASDALMASALNGVIFQEVITRFEKDGPAVRFQKAREDAEIQSQEAGLPAYAIPHAFQTVDEATLASFGASGEPVSIHVAETDLENQLTESGRGAIADTFRDFGVPFTPTGKRVVPTLSDLGLVRPSAQYVHCCAIDEEDIQAIATGGVSVAHCPRSNIRLGCPPAPLREMLDAGILLGLGLDSPASSGPIDMFAEMRAALDVAEGRGRWVTPEEVWHMATTQGAASLAFAFQDLGSWRIEPGSSVPLIAIECEDALSTADLIARGNPLQVRRL